MNDEKGNEPLNRDAGVKDRPADIGPFASNDEKNLPAIHEPSDNQTGAQEDIDRKIAATSDPNDAYRLVELRGLVIEQDESRKDRKQARKESNREFWFNSSLKLVAIGVGVTVMYTFNPYLGCFILGIGLYGLAPKLIETFFGKKRKDGDESDA